MDNIRNCVCCKHFIDDNMFCNKHKTKAAIFMKDLNCFEPIEYDKRTKCKCCASSDNVLYQATAYIRLYMSRLEKRRTLKVESIEYKNPLTLNEYVTKTSEFFINFCPECGRDLRE